MQSLLTFLKKFGLIVLAGLVSLFVIEKILTVSTSQSPTEKAIAKKLAKEEHAKNSLSFDLVDPELAPKELKKEVLYGYDLMVNTHKLLPDNARDGVSCANCHFSGGNTTGGKNGGISLVGTAAMYPAFNKRSGQVIDLPQRINNCFERSLNGKALKPDSDEMVAFVTYLTWISKNYPIYLPPPWRGLKPLKSKVIGDSEKGKALYISLCASCHGQNGDGQNDQTELIPPLWGKRSFNNGAGMAKPETLSSFIYYNMPYEEAELTEDEAIHITNYILSQPRPEW